MINKTKYKPMDCPVCGNFIFSDLDESDIDTYEYLQCPSCGWKYDLYQTEHPNSKEGLNRLSLHDFREEYIEKIHENPQYHYQEDNYVSSPHKCPVCNRHTFSDEGSFEICPICGWQDDSLMENEPDKWAGCSNDLCMTDFKKRYLSSLKKKSK